MNKIRLENIFSELAISLASYDYERRDVRLLRELCDEVLGYKQIEEEIGIDLATLFKAQTRGFYFKDYQDNNEIKFSGNTFIVVGNQFVQTKPCYEVKETTLYSCYDPMKYPSPNMKVKDAHFWSWKTHPHFRLCDYGKTWALTKEELE